MMSALRPLTTDQIAFRPIAPEDRPFLYRVYAGTRERELALVGWTEEEKADFLRMQFEAQHTYYQQMFPDASFQLILREDTPIGRLYIDRRSDEIRIVDIALLPEHRDRGIGSAIMRDILAEGKAQGLPVRIHVERNNPALRLYRRMGFKKIGETGVYLLMERRPADASPKGSERC